MRNSSLLFYKVMSLAFLFPLIASSDHEENFCPTENCMERKVSDHGDEGDRSLRAVLQGACRDAGDDAIAFRIWQDIELASPIVIPADCNGRVFFYGQPHARPALDGSRVGIQRDALTDNCLLRVESDENRFEYLAFVSYENADDDREDFPGMGLCLLGNRNQVRKVSVGARENSIGQHANDVGIYISGHENTVTTSEISQNHLDGILIKGDNNTIQENYIGYEYQNCFVAFVSDEPVGEDPEPDPEPEPELEPEPEPREVARPRIPEVDAVPPIPGVADDQGQTEVSVPTVSCQLIKSPTKSIVKKGTIHGIMNDLTCPLVANGANGIRITDAARGNLIGGTGKEDYNIIRYNGGAGVRLDGDEESSENEIRGNVFYRNYGLGIDLGPVGVNTNDVEDGDNGPNLLLNYPDQLSVTMRQKRENGRNRYWFLLEGHATPGQELDAYLTDGSTIRMALESQGDESGHGEGEFFIDRFEVPDDPDLHGEDERFVYALPAIISRGTKLTTLLVDREGNTSEFSKNLILESDVDRDGILDLIEDQNRNELVDEGESDPFDIDSDDDGLIDGLEDTNKNGRRDAGELSAVMADTDQDGVSDYIETRGDGQYDLEKGDTDPFDPDGDCDGLLDGEEDRNGNGIVEFQRGESDPRRADSDEDGVPDGPGCEGNVRAFDNCPQIPNPDQLDNDEDGVGDVCTIP
jgi:hypothetical protein